MSLPTLLRCKIITDQVHHIRTPVPLLLVQSSRYLHLSLLADMTLQASLHELPHLRLDGRPHFQVRSPEQLIPTGLLHQLQSLLISPDPLPLEIILQHIVPQKVMQVLMECL